MQPSDPRERRPGRRALVASVAVHLVALLGMWASGFASPALPDAVVYRVDLVSPPPQEAGEPAPAAEEAPAVREPDAAEPEPARPDPEPEREEPPQETPPRPETPRPQTTRTERDPEPAPPQPTRGDAPDPSSRGGDDVNVRIEGEAFAFPGYLENIIRQNKRFFRWTGDPGLRACVYYEIQGDGSVRNIQVTRPSGNFRFDLEARGAVESAGDRRAYGPLPDGWPHQVLPISFSFSPNATNITCD